MPPPWVLCSGVVMWERAKTAKKAGGVFGKTPPLWCGVLRPGGAATLARRGEGVLSHFYPKKWETPFFLPTSQIRGGPQGGFRPPAVVIQPEVVPRILFTTDALPRNISLNRSE